MKKLVFILLLLCSACTVTKEVQKTETKKECCSKK